MSKWRGKTECPLQRQRRRAGRLDVHTSGVRGSQRGGQRFEPPPLIFLVFVVGAGFASCPEWVFDHGGDVFG
jgi:hypothetical protein